MTGVTTHRTTPVTETKLMVLVACPICDADAAWDDACAALDCPACDVRLELAQEADPERLPLAA
jgi:hypothetical protein